MMNFELSKKTCNEKKLRESYLNTYKIVGLHFHLLRITYISGEKAGESTSAKDERIIMLHTILLYC